MITIFEIMQVDKDSEREFFKQEGTQGQNFKKCMCLRIREKEIRKEKVVIYEAKL